MRNEYEVVDIPKGMAGSEVRALIVACGEEVITINHFGGHGTAVVVTESSDPALSLLSKAAKVPGFRPGKVPMSVIRSAAG
ncbi:trigger factor [Pseudomonas sp. PSE1(2024)]|jgi:hypothetical protein|uniref:trigger factor n=1 Tax=Pseudomonas sp. PSE1(2024) TaxID=3228746 RepID=UPI003D991EC0